MQDSPAVLTNGSLSVDLRQRLDQMDTAADLETTTLRLEDEQQKYVLMVLDIFEKTANCHILLPVNNMSIIAHWEVKTLQRGSTK